MRLILLLLVALSALAQVAPSKAPPKTQLAWFQEGEAFLNTKDYDSAIKAFEEAEKLGYLPRSTRFRMATAAAAKGDASETLRHMERAVEAGFGAVYLLESNPVFQAIRKTPEFQEIERRAAHPCQNHAAFKKLDFWVGDWAVVSNDPKREASGTNKIEKTLDGCAIIENWRDVTGHEGKSFFALNIVTGKWKQLWVQDDTGYKEKDLIEELPDGGVRFQGKLAAPGGRVIYDRTTLTPMKDGSVRQHIEQSLNGKVWQTTFDALYVPAK